MKFNWPQSSILKSNSLAVQANAVKTSSIKPRGFYVGSNSGLLMYNMIIILCTSFYKYFMKSDKGVYFCIRRRLVQRSNNRLGYS